MNPIDPREIYSYMGRYNQKRHRSLTWATHQPDDSEAGRRMAAHGGRPAYEAEIQFRHVVAGLCKRAIERGWTPPGRAFGIYNQLRRAEHVRDMPEVWRLRDALHEVLFPRILEARQRDALARDDRDRRYNVRLPPKPVSNRPLQRPRSATAPIE